MKLVVSDLSNIEGRILAYLAGEEWKLQAFRDYDAGNGPDLYNITATSIVGGDPYDVPKPTRNAFGKVPDLALGYEGGAGALQTFAKAYHISMLDNWSTIKQNVKPTMVAKAFENYDEWGLEKAQEMGVPCLEWIASESVKLAWRDRHPATRQLWYDLKDAARNAIRNPNRTFGAGPHLKLRVQRHAGMKWLLILLPSGKYLTYFNPKLNGEGNILYTGYGQEGEATARVWSQQYTYGGKMAEHCSQALAGDVLKANMPAIEAAGYEIVLTVHDEDVTQAPDTAEYNAERLSELVAVPPPWAPDLPLAAAGFEGYRYKKED